MLDSLMQFVDSKPAVADPAKGVTMSIELVLEAPGERKEAEFRQIIWRSTVGQLEQDLPDASAGYSGETALRFVPSPAEARTGGEPWTIGMQAKHDHNLTVQIECAA